MITATRLKWVSNAYYHTCGNKIKDSRWFLTHEQYHRGKPRATKVHTVHELVNVLSMIGIYIEKEVCAVIVSNEHTHQQRYIWCICSRVLTGRRWFL